MKRNEEVLIFNQEVGNRIKELRDNLGWSQEDLAAKAQLSTVFISHVESGISGMNAYNLVQIAKALNVPITTLVFGDLKNMDDRLYENFTKVSQLDAAKKKLAWKVIDELIDSLIDME